MSKADQATTRARAQRQQQQEQQQAWERERSELLRQMQELTARLGALEESTGGATGQTSAGPTSAGQTSGGVSIKRGIKPLIKSLPRFSGVTGQKPSSQAWTSLLKATVKGNSADEVLSYLPTYSKETLTSGMS